MPSVPSTFSLTTAKDQEKDVVTTNEPESLDLYSQDDVDSNWKLAFGVCLAIIIILLAGRLLDYRSISRLLGILFPGVERIRV